MAYDTATCRARAHLNTITATCQNYNARKYAYGSFLVAMMTNTCMEIFHCISEGDLCHPGQDAVILFDHHCWIIDAVLLCRMVSWRQFDIQFQCPVRASSKGSGIHGALDEQNLCLKKCWSEICDRPSTLLIDNTLGHPEVILKPPWSHLETILRKHLEAILSDLEPQMTSKFEQLFLVFWARTSFSSLQVDMFKAILGPRGPSEIKIS